MVQGGRLAELLNGRSMTSNSASTNFWAVDKIILAYFAFATLLILGWWSSVPDALELFTWHVLGAALLIFEVKRGSRTGFEVWICFIVVVLSGMWFGCSWHVRQAVQCCGAVRLSQSAKRVEPSSGFSPSGTRLRFSRGVPK